MLIWIYYSAQIVLFGAEFTQVYANDMGSRIVPTDKAVLVDEATSDSMEPTPAHSRPQPAVGRLAPAISSPPQPEDQPPLAGDDPSGLGRGDPLAPVFGTRRISSEFERRTRNDRHSATEWVRDITSREGEGTWLESRR